MANIDRVKFNRKPKRGQSTKLVNQMNAALAAPDPDLEELEANLAFLVELHVQLDEMDQKITDAMYDAGTSEADQTKEFEDCESYKLKFLRLKKKVEKLTQEKALSEGSFSTAIGGETAKRNFKLPKIELRKFSGELTDWLGFWSQFDKIDGDDSLHATDKFHYLVQAMTKGTDAHEMVTSYPQTEDNYPKVVEALKRRFGNSDLLLQVYIRELLKLVISNVNSDDKLTLETLYLKLESHLRALKSLKLEDADPASWLLPLVESSIPEELLLTWQRSQLASQDGSKLNPPKSRLDYMMEFLSHEVEYRQRVILARGGFGAEDKKKPSGTEKAKRVTETPTLAGFVSGESHSCVFCGKNHASQECFRAQRMTLEEKKKLLSERKSCFVCFSNKHFSRNCKFSVKCMVCGDKHYTIMCPKIDETRRTESSNDDKEETSSELLSGMTCHGADIMCSGKVPLQTLMVKIHGPKCVKTIRAFYDGGCQRSYVLTSLASELGLLPIACENVVHGLFGGGVTAPTDQSVFKVKLSNISGTYSCILAVRDREKLAQKIRRIPTSAKSLLHELKQHSASLSDVGNDVPDISLVIGNDVLGKLYTGRKLDMKCGLTAIDTKLGWVISGIFEDTIKDNITTAFLSMSVNELSVTQLWDLDTIGVRDSVQVKTEYEQAKEAKQLLLSSIERKENGRYVVKLPWKVGHPALPKNREIAYKRLQVAVKKLEDNNLFPVYHNLFREWTQMGFIERVPNCHLERKSHLLPHRPVVKPESLTTPVRPVFDASCKAKNSVSLNDCLEKGINYVQLIPDIILRFREKKVAFTSDIKKAFQMIEVHESDRDMMRFLWFEETDKKKVIEYRHKRVMFGATCSPFILGAVIEHHLSRVKLEDKEVAEKLLESLYVDNCVASLDSEEEYDLFRKKSVQLLSEAQMDLRLWMANTDSHINAAETFIPLLGLTWDRITDTLLVDVPVWKEKVITKRVVLSSIQKVFDPIGFTAPALIPMKCLLQDTWIAKLKWDDVLPEEQKLKFIDWVQQLQYLGKIKLPRLATTGETDRQKWSLHIFTDASKESYAAAAFLRVETTGGGEVFFLEAKARVAPLKRPSIPRLELLGCMIGSRLAASIRKALKLEGVPEFCWSDSTTAIAWIKRNDNWTTFVGNRVAEICKNTSPENWRHVPGLENPADLPSRGCSPAQLVESRWWEGPAWLKMDVMSWPDSREEAEDNEVDMEKRKTPLKQATMSNLEDRSNLYNYPYAASLRIMAYVIRFCKSLKIKRKIITPLTLAEIRQAELQLWKTVQKQAFPNHENTGMKVFLDSDGLLRVKTRIVFREDLVEFKFPILLPRKHPLVQKFIEQMHRDYCHAGAAFIMCKIRQRFWILQSRRAIKTVISHCQRCRRFSVKPATVEEAPLPMDRVQGTRVFQVVGIDLAGPLHLKHGRKAWIVIFTCAVFRAVHLEAVVSLSSKAFVGALKKFVMIYGRMETIYCDNGTNFVGAANSFKKLDWESITKEEGIKNISFKFNPPSAAWWGGWWERLIRTMKDLMKRMLGKATLTLGELQEVLSSVKEVMNGRPLTYVSENPEDLQPLTPAMFLNPCESVRFPEVIAGEGDKLRLRYKYVNTLKEELMKRFRNEYLSQLIHKPKGRTTRPLEVGEIVLIGRDDRKRLEWPLGRIVELKTGKDGNVRVARVKVQDGELWRPVQRLYPMEVGNGESEKLEMENIVKTRSGRKVKIPIRFTPEVRLKK